MKKILATILAAAFAGVAWGTVETTTIQDAAGADMTVYVIADGFYQDGASYNASGNFYITNKAGLLHFRTLVNADDGGDVALAYCQDYFTNLSQAYQFYQNNVFKNKTVHLLTDIDLNNEDWTPIGFPNQGFNGGSSKTYFYGSFDGHGHVISNVKVVANANNQSNPAKSWKNYGNYGLFGYASDNGGPTFQNLTIHNFSAVNGTTVTEMNYVGAFVGDTGSTSVYTFRNCHVTGEVSISNAWGAGGLVGVGNVNVIGCSIEATGGTGVEGDSWAGGLVGAARGTTAASNTISDNTVSGLNVVSGSSAGALVGQLADGAAGEFSITQNTVDECKVNDENATQASLISQNSGETAALTVVENTVSVPPVVISVQSANLFGAIKMTGVASNLYVAVPFEGFAGGAREAQDLIHAANLEPGTKMYVWNKGEDKYDVYEVSSEHKWIAPISITVKEDKDGKEAYAATTADLTRGVAPGAGVILARKDTAQAVHVYGQVPATVTPPPPFSAGQTLVSVPSTNAMAAVGLNAFTWSGVAETRSNRLKGKASADYIQFRAADGSLVQYYYEGDSKWGLPSAQAKKHPELVPDGKALVPAGTAFWYYRNPAASGNASVAW